MGKVLSGKRVLAAILIVIVVVSVTGLSAYQVINNQRFTQQSYMLGLVLFQIGQPRIVSCAPSIDEMLVGLGLEEYLVGCASHTYAGSAPEDFYLPKLWELILAGKIKNSIDWWSPSLEEIVKLNPTIVLLDSGTSSHVSLYPSLANQGIPAFLVSKGSRISEIENAILNLGTLFKKDLTAQALVNKMNAKIAGIQENVSGQQVVNVLMCVWLSISGNYLYTCGNQTFLSEMIQKAGGLNVYYDSVVAWFSVSLDAAAEKNPDVIIILDHTAYLNPLQTLSGIGQSPLNTTNAWHNQMIYFIQGQADNLFTRSGPRVAEGVELLAKMLFPTLFGVTFGDVPYVVNTNNYKGYLSSFILE
ncbi:MAG: helical backbone metal receptor [Candidatus Jordarchaeaceae archaeon]